MGASQRLLAGASSAAAATGAACAGRALSPPASSSASAPAPCVAPSWYDAPCCGPAQSFAAPAPPSGDSTFTARGASSVTAASILLAELTAMYVTDTTATMRPMITDACDWFSVRAKRLHAVSGLFVMALYVRNVLYASTVAGGSRPRLHRGERDSAVSASPTASVCAMKKLFSGHALPNQWNNRLSTTMEPTKRPPAFTMYSTFQQFDSKPGDHPAAASSSSRASIFFSSA